MTTPFATIVESCPSAPNGWAFTALIAGLLIGSGIVWLIGRFEEKQIQLEREEIDGWM